MEAVGSRRIWPWKGWGATHNRRKGYRSRQMIRGMRNAASSCGGERLLVQRLKEASVYCRSRS